MNLREQQRTFIKAVFAGTNPDGVDPRGMAVYTNNYRGQLLACLRDTYEKTVLWLGDDAFDIVASRYIDGHVPSSWTLDAYGEAFTRHLEETYPVDDEVAEIAWLDWHLRHAFSGPDAESMGVRDLDADDWDRVELKFVPTLRFRRMRSNAVAIWRALADGVSPPSPLAVDEGVGARVWRNGLSPQFASMTADETACLDLALTGATFGELCAFLARTHDAERTTRIAGGCLGAWTAEGMIHRISSSHSSM